MIEFLNKTKTKGLHPNRNGKSGLLIIKENVRRRQVIIDKTDGSITRTSGQLIKIFDEAGFQKVHHVYECHEIPEVQLETLATFILRPRPY